MESQVTRRLSAIMFTDIVGYSAIMQKDETIAAEIRAHHRQEFRKFHNQYNGNILQYYGDGTLSVFDSGVEAVECAIAIQKALQQGQKVPLRIGIHIGDIVSDGTEVYGDGVNLASRIESLGVAGAILVSGVLNDQLSNHPAITTASLGEFRLKNIDRPVEIYSVTNEGIRQPEPSELRVRPETKSKSIAVLPFVNNSSHEESEYFSDGITEEIINALSKIGGLKVTSRTSSFFYKGKDVALREIGEALNVSTILEGSIRLSGNMLRITAQLINVADDFHFWSEKWDRKLENIFEIQDEISLLIAEKLREDMGHFDISDHLVEAPEIPVAIYKKYLKGRYDVLSFNVSSTERGISMLQEIVDAYPQFPLPYIEINNGYAFLGAVGMMSPDEAFAKGNSYLNKAIELDPKLPECQYGLAGTSYWHKWDLDATFKHLNKAIAIRPGYADAYQTMSPVLLTVGRFDAALTYINKALQLDPFSATNHHLKGLVYYYQEDYEEALLHIERSIDLDPNYIMSQIIYANLLLIFERTDEALKIYQSFPSDRFSDLSRLGGITLIHACQGERQKAEEGIKKLEETLRSDSQGWAVEFLMLCYIRLEKYDQALELIEYGVNQRIPMMLTIAADPMMKPLYQLPKFEELIEQILGKEYTKELSVLYHGSPRAERPKELKLSPEMSLTDRKPLLDQKSSADYARKTVELMASDAPYLMPQLTLKGLADLIGIHPNQLSWLLNNHFDKSFNDFINHYRIEAFKRYALDPEKSHITLIGLAYESGFNSKTTFNTYFKKEVGSSPKVWMKLAKEQSA